RIFEPFYTKKKMGQSGTGLGMPVVWWTMADHNGYIDVKSKEGKGTTFELFFPATTKKRSVKQPFPTIEIERMRGNGEKILVVDDEMGQREVVSMLLTRLGYSVDVAESGEKAIGYVETNPVDLLILDMIMDGGIDGLDTYREIIKRRPGTKAIIVSGFTETERVKEVLQLGASEFVKKPYTLDAIGKAVKNILQGSQ
ncbi:MAG: response regulator, partial [bacterium]|nr:response regulator [bacterium]